MRQKLTNLQIFYLGLGILGGIVTIVTIAVSIPEIADKYPGLIENPTNPITTTPEPNAQSPQAPIPTPASITEPEKNPQIKISNLPPIPKIEAKKIAYRNEPIIFDATNSIDLDGKIESYLWVFSDGTVLEEGKVVHGFSSSQDHVVMLTVTDDDGESNNLRHFIDVIPVTDHEFVWIPLKFRIESGINDKIIAGKEFTVFNEFLELKGGFTSTVCSRIHVLTDFGALKYADKFCWLSGTLKSYPSVFSLTIDEPGEYGISETIDYDNRIQELDEQNNIIKHYIVVEKS